MNLLNVTSILRFIFQGPIEHLDHPKNVTNLELLVHLANSTYKYDSNYFSNPHGDFLCRHIRFPDALMAEVILEDDASSTIMEHLDHHHDHH